eukprot:Blabericola_migrator_1__540@NODE_1132_length_5334_cov_152_116575_g770_i1_p3_GENE_NODE_1132_length_5334_cov_152_116575_g770_i1NODE_1132_length_5334_cov_152_116575_g770_i1_p3_ORF_typecomplete_len127_score18_89PAP_assoc/PF03828_19/0_14_NODE_1132_length_5334_cov_152_116575_g770_i148685248
MHTVSLCTSKVSHHLIIDGSSSDRLLPDSDSQLFFRLTWLLPSASVITKSSSSSSSACCSSSSSLSRRFSKVLLSRILFGFFSFFTTALDSFCASSIGVSLYIPGMLTIDASKAQSRASQTSRNLF